MIDYTRYEIWCSLILVAMLCIGILFLIIDGIVTSIKPKRKEEPQAVSNKTTYGYGFFEEKYQHEKKPGKLKIYIEQPKNKQQ